MKFDNDWQEHIGEEFNKAYYLKIRQYLKEEYKNNQVFPEMHHIFNALKWTAYSEVKVVILGQVLCSS